MRQRRLYYQKKGKHGYYFLTDKTGKRVYLGRARSIHYQDDYLKAVERAKELGLELRPGTRRPYGSMVKNTYLSKKIYVGYWIQQYLNETRDRISKGIIATQTLNSKLTAMNHFKNYIGQQALVGSLVRTRALHGFYGYLNNLNLKGITKNKIMNNVVTWFHWLVENKLITDIPPHKDLSFVQEVPSVVTFSYEQLRDLWVTSDLWFKGLILLGLNVGITTAEMCDVRIEGDYFDTPRVKTKEARHHYLWKITKEYSKHIPQKLTRHKIQNYYRSIRKEGWPDLRILRKTTASWIAANTQNVYVVQMYLAHKPKTLAESVYIQRDWSPLDNALKQIEHRINMLFGTDTEYLDYITIQEPDEIIVQKTYTDDEIKDIRS